MQAVLFGFENFSLAYIDDVITYSSTFEEHLQHISKVLERLANANLTVKRSKCSWVCFSSDFLGFCIGSEKISIPQLRSFLGLCNFYSRFIAHFAILVAPLNSLLRRTSPDTLPWNDDHDVSYSSIITAIINHSSLIIPNSGEVRCVFSDASTTGIGGALCVCRNNYMDALLILELEALALLETVEQFRLYLAGRQFKAFTDHQALSGILDGVQLSSKLTRWKWKLADYDIAIEHIKGLHNHIADSLSRQGWSEPDSP